MSARALAGKAPAAQDWRALLAAPAPSIADLERTIYGLRADAAAAEATVLRLRDARRAILLGGTDDELKAHDDQAGVAIRTIERSAAAVEELEVKLAEAHAAADEALRREAYDAASKQVDAARQRLRADYPKAVTIVRGLLRALAEAEKVRLAANADLPARGVPIASAEDVRGPMTLPEKVLSRARVKLWIDPTTKQPFNDRDQDVIGSDGAGSLSLKPPIAKQHLRQSVFERVTYLPEVLIPGLPELASVLELPALSANHTPGYRSPLRHESLTDAGWQSLVLAVLDTFEAPPADIDRVPRHEIIPVE